MNGQPSVLSAITYFDTNKQLLKDWLWKIFNVSLLKDHRTLVTRGGNYAGFFVKSGTFYYATLIHPKGS